MPADFPTPKIISRGEHPISRSNIDREALKVMHRLRDAGYSAYLVGGGVRDLILGKTPKDFDISTDARPGQLRKLFRNSRVIGRRFRLVQVFFHGNKIIEVSTLRCLSEFDIDGPEEVLPSNNTFGTLGEDAMRRDLTINSLFYEIENFTVIDYVGGVEDLRQGIIRLVGDSARRIRRDPVRMLRAIRHAARNDFKIEEKTWAAICGHVDYLQHCPDSRIRDELFKDLKDGASSKWAALAIDSGLFTAIFPVYSSEILASLRSRILSALSISDRLHLEGGSLPEHVLMALILLPWAEKVAGLFGAPPKGEAAFNFTRGIRGKVDQMLQRLNIKRAQKEAITGLLVNLPVFVRHGGKGEWPKWLVRKSYFKDGVLFYRIYKEMEGGTQVRPESAKALRPVPRKKEGPGKVKHRGARTPAFANSTKGGVFGLRKK